MLKSQYRLLDSGLSSLLSSDFGVFDDDSRWQNIKDASIFYFYQIESLLIYFICLAWQIEAM